MILPVNVFRNVLNFYPWEWMIDESPDGCLAQVEWLEPIWKLVMSNKAILSILYELFRLPLCITLLFVTSTTRSIL